MKRFISFILLVILYIPMLLVFPVIITGRKNIRRKGRVIICANHQTNLDPLIMWGRIFRRRFRYMAKESLFHNKFLGYLFSCVGAYPVNRSATDISAIKKTLGFLKEDKAVCIFPEGTRLKTDEANELKSGVVVFALKTGSPIVPSMYHSKIRPFCFCKYTIGQEFDLAQEIGYNAGDKITPEVINAGLQVLHDKMFELRKEKN